jgi:hypothetical protein
MAVKQNIIDFIKNGLWHKKLVHHLNHENLNIKIEVMCNIS